MSGENPYKPYFKAVKKILDGTPVENLDEIRDQCNDAFLRKKPSRSIEGYTPEFLVMSFAANAENKILMREVLEESCGFTPSFSREKSREFLRDAVKRYL